MKLYNIDEILYVINNEMAMYDDLAKNEKYKKDREIAKNKWSALESLYNEIKKIKPEKEA
jgi:hypothetical protein